MMKLTAEQQRRGAAAQRKRCELQPQVRLSPFFPLCLGASVSLFSCCFVADFIPVSP